MVYDSISYGTRVDNYDGNSEGFPVGASDGASLSLIDSIMLFVAYSYKLREYFCCKLDASLPVFS